MVGDTQTPQGRAFVGGMEKALNTSLALDLPFVESWLILAFGHIGQWLPPGASVNVPTPAPRRTRPRA